jgi:hypothetical protein
MSDFFPIFSGFFNIGTDYPVNAHSLIRASPSKIMPSKGILICLFKNTISPGASLVDETYITYPPRKTLIIYSLYAIS